MHRTHTGHRLTSLHRKGNKPPTVSVRYRSLNRVFNWCVAEKERSDNPMDRVDPPKIPSETQAYYQTHEVVKIIRAIGRTTPHNLLILEQFVKPYEDQIPLRPPLIKGD